MVKRIEVDGQAAMEMALNLAYLQSAPPPHPGTVKPDETVSVFLRRRTENRRLVLWFGRQSRAGVATAGSAPAAERGGVGVFVYREWRSRTQPRWLLHAAQANASRIPGGLLLGFLPDLPETATITGVAARIRGSLLLWDTSIPTAASTRSALRWGRLRGNP